MSEQRRKSAPRSSSRYLPETDQSLSPSSISGASSSLNTSTSDCGRPVRSERTSAKIKYFNNREFHQKVNNSDDIGPDGDNDTIDAADDDVYNISVLSSCTCNDPDEDNHVHTDDDETRRKSSKTRNTLKRLTSFMRKDKSKNLSLVDPGGPASLKYSRYKITTFVCQYMI